MTIVLRAHIPFAFALSVISLHAAIVTTESTDGTLAPGNAASVVAGVSGVTGTDVAEYDLTVNFNPIVLSYVSVDFGDPLLGDELDLYGYGSSLNVNTANVASGVVEVSEIAYDSPQDLASYQPDAFGLFTVNFTALNNGSSPVSSVANSLGDGLGDNILSGYGPPAIILVASATPEPSTVSLIAIGLAAGFAYYRYSARKRAALLPALLANDL